jgi:hypothetical protein
MAKHNNSLFLYDWNLLIMVFFSSALFGALGLRFAIFWGFGAFKFG